MILFSIVEKFYQILLMDKDIAAGWYCTEDGKTTSVAHWLEEDDFRTNGGVMLSLIHI